MSWHKDKATLGLIIGILIAVAVAAFQSVLWDRFLPLLAVAILALIFLSIVTNAEARIRRELDQRLPAISYMDRRKEVELASSELVERALEFIVATGARSRNQEYFRII